MSALAEVRFATSRGGQLAAAEAGAVLADLLEVLEVADVGAEREAAELRLLEVLRNLSRGGRAALVTWLVQGELAVQLDPDRAPRVQLVGADALGPNLRRCLEPWQLWHQVGAA